jgi:hypothetical protein
MKDLRNAGFFRLLDLLIPTFPGTFRSRETFQRNSLDRCLFSLRRRLVVARLGHRAQD